jgi:hypothetical protein
VDIQPTAPTLTSYSLAIAGRRKGVAAKIAVLDAIATSRAGATDGLTA